MTVCLQISIKYFKNALKNFLIYVNICLNQCKNRNQILCKRMVPVFINLQINKRLAIKRPHYTRRDIRQFSPLKRHHLYTLSGYL